jgi:hypothetical protein
VDQPDIPTRIAQIHRSYLDTEYRVDYYAFVRDRTSRFAKHLDFAIGMGALGSGGSGLGILGDPQFAWLCGILTTLSLILAVAKSNYDWPGRISKATELLEYFRSIATQYRNLIDDLNYRKTLSAEFETLHLKLRSDSLNAPADPYPSLSNKKQQKIQESTNSRINRAEWWKG